MANRDLRRKKTFIEAHMGTLKARGDLYNDLASQGVEIIASLSKVFVKLVGG